jgi:hypothetical protein
VIQAAENYIYELVARAMPRKQARIFIVTLDRARADPAFILVLRFQVPALAESFDYHKSPLSICPNHFPRDFLPPGHFRISALCLSQTALRAHSPRIYAPPIVSAWALNLHNDSSPFKRFIVSGFR